MSGLEPTHRNILEHELSEVRRAMAELAVTEGYLLRRLGGDPGDDLAAEGLGNDPSRGSASIGATGNVADAVNPMQFYGMSVTKGAAAVLTLVGRDRPLRTREIYEALTKGGLNPKTVEVVGKMLKRDKKFHQLRRGIWGLAEWYPSSVLARGNTDTDLQSELDADADEVSGTEGDTSNDEAEVSAEVG